MKPTYEELAKEVDLLRRFLQQIADMPKTPMWSYNIADAADAMVYLAQSGLRLPLSIIAIPPEL